MILYKYIFDGNTQTFDLTKRKPAFDIFDANIIDDNEEKTEADESAIDRVIEEDNKERNDMIITFKDMPLKTLFSDRFHMTFNGVKHGTRIGRGDEDEFVYHHTGMNIIFNQVYKGFTAIDIDINKELH